MELIVRTLGNAAGLWLATSLLAGLSVPQGGSTAAMWINLVVLGLVLALVNSLIKPVARLVALPLYILTFGLFALVVNGAMLSLTGWLTDNLDALGAGGSVPLGLEVSSFGAAVAGSLIVSVISALIVALLGPRED
ncbi:phage holin family protein [Actinomyces capricornis]|uniref:Membrane protein n=1 Tax=Actinomyces capricornis TaxID=2755559 RepID=A0ABM7UAG6_9ACTO|nr:phage holin family protein [Actinomyces capricornis]BDA64339.1 membrane protein [Actinomyces capricornis]